MCEGGWTADGTGPDPTGAAVVERGTPARGAADGWYPRTFLLTDVVDSVFWWERHPAAMSQPIAWHEAVIRDAVDSTGGEMVRTKGEGDSTFSVFTHPAELRRSAPWRSRHGAMTRPDGCRGGRTTSPSQPWRISPATNERLQSRRSAATTRTRVSSVVHSAGLVSTSAGSTMTPSRRCEPGWVPARWPRPPRLHAPDHSTS
jgi:hypothetical protein